MTTRCDVLVVGGGPAGATAARTAVEHGASVVLLERDARPRVKVCGEDLSPGAVRRLREIGFGAVLDEAASSPLLGMRLFAPNGREVRTHFPPDWPGLSIRRDDFDPRLVAACGADGRRGARLVSMEERPDGIRARLADGGLFDAAVVVGADGRNSVVAQRSGLRVRGARPPRGTVHAYYEGVAGREPFGEMHLPGDGTYIGLNPGPDGLVNVTFVCDLCVVQSKESTSARDVLARVLRTVPSLRERFRHARLAGSIRVLAPLEVKTSRAHDERVLLAGDAAGFFDPLTGEGLFGAVVTGAMAGRWAASAALAGDVSRRFLAGYSRERRRAFGAKARLNAGFQCLLGRPALLDLLGKRLSGRRRVADTLIGVIGNARRPAALLHPRNLYGLLFQGTDE